MCPPQRSQAILRYVISDTVRGEAYRWHHPLIIDRLAIKSDSGAIYSPARPISVKVVF
jgi:hypothetical protein